MQQLPIISPFRLAAKSERGSSLVVVIIFSIVTLVLCASILRLASSENKATSRHKNYLVAKDCAESIAEYGFYQVRKAAESTNDFNVNKDMFRTGFYVPKLPTLTAFSDMNLVTAGANAPVLAAGITKVVPGDGQTYFVDPADLNNAADPLQGKWVFRRDVSIYAKATVEAPGFPPVTAYMTETISVRGAPLFAHAIFYNMDLELFPGPTMKVYGPVHANGDIFTSSQGSNSLNYYSIVTASGNIYHAWKSMESGARGTGTESLGTGAVNFTRPSGVSSNMLKDGVWRDSTMGESSTIAGNSTLTFAQYKAALAASAKTNSAAYREMSLAAWDHNVMTKAHGIDVYKPVAIGEYVEDTNYSDGVDSSVNTGRLLIEPPTPSTSGNYDKSIEEQKYSANAGIYLSVNPSTGVITASSRKKSSLGTSKSVTIPAGNNLVKWIPYKKTQKITRTVETSTKVAKNNYTVTKNVTVTDNEWNAAGAVPGTPVTTTSNRSSTSSVSTDTTDDTGQVYVSGMYDKRRDTPMNIVEIDVGAMRDVVAQMQEPSGSRHATKALGNFDSSDWTGIVYVEVEGGAVTNKDGSSVAASTLAGRTAVRVVNGTGQVPSYDGDGQEKGLAIATNAALYVKGHFNADGSIVDAVSPTDYETNEKPAALIGDSFTVLSSEWSDSTSVSSNSTQSTSVSTEISAAILAGLVPTRKDGIINNSGGAHNFINFRQNHSGKVAIRGSIVALFESRMNPGLYGSDYYSPPTRLWGFSKQFAEGTFPPGTPKVLSYRRVNFTTMDGAKWADEVSKLDNP